MFKYDLNNFGPFEVDTWGNVSDWAMVLVTGITGYLIWKTFLSQLELTRIEQNNFRLRALPELKAGIRNQTISVTVSQNPIKVLRTAYIKLNRLQYFNLHHHHGDYDPGAEISVNTSISISVSGDGKMKRKVLHDEIIFFFLDKQDNLYQQVLIHNPNYLYVRPQTAIFIKNLNDNAKFEEVVDQLIKEQDLIKNRNL